MPIVSVAEASDQLGVIPRRVRRMLADSVLPGRRIGRDWVIEQSALDRFIHHRPPEGRPWQASSAWAVLVVADGDHSRLSSVDRSRARRRLDGQGGLAGLVDRLAARAEVWRLFGHPSILRRLESEPGLIRSGVSAAADYRADIIAAEFFEAYVRSSRLSALVKRFHLDADADRPNILLRAVDDKVWPFDPGARLAPRAVVAIDLLEADDERSRRAGVMLASRR